MLPACAVPEMAGGVWLVSAIAETVFAALDAEPVWPRRLTSSRHVIALPMSAALRAYDGPVPTSAPARVQVRELDSGDGVQEPAEHVSVLPSTALPEIVGAELLVSGSGDTVTALLAVVTRPVSMVPKLNPKIVRETPPTAVVAHVYWEPTSLAFSVRAPDTAPAAEPSFRHSLAGDPRMLSWIWGSAM